MTEGNTIQIGATTPGQPRVPVSAIFLLILLALDWGLLWPVMKFAVGEMPYMTFRMVTAWGSSAAIFFNAYQPVEKGVIDRVSRHGEAYRGEGGFAILRDDEDDLNDQDGSSGRNKHEQGANSARHGLLRGAGADELAHQQR